MIRWIDADRLASHPDLVTAFGVDDTETATVHFIHHSFGRVGRTTC